MEGGGLKTIRIPENVFLETRKTIWNFLWQGAEAAGERACNISPVASIIPSETIPRNNLPRMGKWSCRSSDYDGNNGCECDCKPCQADKPRCRSVKATENLRTHWKCGEGEPNAAQYLTHEFFWGWERLSNAS